MGCRTRVGVFLLLTMLMAFVGGYLLFDRIGLSVATVASISFSVFVYVFAASKVQQALGGVELEGQDAWGLVAMVHAQAKAQNIKAPRVFWLEDSAPQILVVSGAYESRLLVTRGLVENLSPRHLEALVAYHITSMRLHYSFAACVGACVLGGIFFVTDCFDRVLRLLLVERRNLRVRMSQAFSSCVAPVLGVLLPLLMGRHTHSLCDAETARVLKTPKALAEALWHLQAYSKTKAFVVEPMFLPLLMLPVVEGTWAARLQNLKPTPRRIENVIGHYPI